MDIDTQKIYSNNLYWPLYLGFFEMIIYQVCGEV